MLTDLAQKLSAVYQGEIVESAVYRKSRPNSTRLKPARASNYFCPICQYWHRRFLPFGLNARPNAACPECGSLERHRFMWRYLRDELKILHRRYRILHIAPEPCIQMRLNSLSNLKYLAIDLYNVNVDKNMDLTALSFCKSSFDLVLCSHVLEHIQNDNLAISEIARVLSKRGTLIAMVPIDYERKVTFEDPTIATPKERNIAFGHPYHVRICGNDYGARIAKGGFNVRQVESWHLPKHLRRLERINKTTIYHCFRY